MVHHHGHAVRRAAHGFRQKLARVRVPGRRSFRSGRRFPLGGVRSPPGLRLVRAGARRFAERVRPRGEGHQDQQQTRARVRQGRGGCVFVSVRGRGRGTHRAPERKRRREPRGERGRLSASRAAAAGTTRSSRGEQVIRFRRLRALGDAGRERRDERVRRVRARAVGNPVRASVRARLRERGEARVFRGRGREGDVFFFVFFSGTVLEERRGARDGERARAREVQHVAVLRGRVPFGNRLHDSL